MASLSDLFKALSDPMRLRIAKLVAESELRVQELGAIVRAPQPTVSRHLAVLLRAGIVRRRRDGQWTYYAWAPDATGEGLDTALRERLRHEHDDYGDQARLRRTLAAREQPSREFFARVAPEWDRLRLGLQPEGLHATLLGAIVPASLVVLDAGTGTGALLPMLAPAARRLIGVDRATEMLAQAERRVRAEELERVALVRAELEALPLADACVDAVASAFALHHVARPQAVIAECARVVRPGGRVVLCDLAPHDQEWMRRDLAHLWMGFALERVAGWCRDAGLEVERTHEALPRAREARRAPEVWVLAARRPHARSSNDRR